MSRLVKVMSLACDVTVINYLTGLTVLLLERYVPGLMKKQQEVQGPWRSA